MSQDGQVGYTTDFHPVALDSPPAWCNLPKKINPPWVPYMTTGCKAYIKMLKKQIKIIKPHGNK